MLFYANVKTRIGSGMMLVYFYSYNGAIVIPNILKLTSKIHIKWDVGYANVVISLSNKRITAHDSISAD